MKIGAMYSHLNGLEFLEYHRPHVLREIFDVIENVNAEKFKTKKSKELTKKGKMLFNPAEINKDFKKQLNKHGWEEERYKYYVTKDVDLTSQLLTLPPKKQLKLLNDEGAEFFKSFNQTDFVKERTAIEIQLGKYTFVAFDIFVKHMGFYISGKIDVGIEIIPTKKFLDDMSSERELHHIVRQGRGNPAVPLLLIGVEA